MTEQIEQTGDFGFEYKTLTVKLNQGSNRNRSRHDETNMKTSAPPPSYPSSHDFIPCLIATQLQSDKLMQPIAKMQPRAP